MRNFDKTSLLEEELNDLRLRFELCEADKKAFFETSQWTIKQNKEDMARLKSDNKQLTDDINALKKYDLDLDSIRTKPSTNFAEKLDQKLIDLQKRFDDLKAQKRLREERVKELDGRHDLVKREAETIKSEEDSEDNRDMSVLENKLDKVNIKQNEANTLRKIYEQLVKVLSEERQQFDQQLFAFGKTLKQKRQDAQDLEEMSKDAERTRDTAKNELARFELRVMEERKHREKEISRLKDIIKHRRVLDEKFDKKLAKQTELPLALDVDKSTTQEMQSNTALLEMQDTLRLVKEKTGFSEVGDLVAKMRELKSTQEHLLGLKTQYEAKLGELKLKKLQLLDTSRSKAEPAAEEQPAAESEASKIATLQASYEEREEELRKTQGEFKDQHAFHEKMTRFQRQALLGVKQLHEKLDGIHPSDDVPKVKVSHENLPVAMEICQKKLVHLVQTLKTREDAEGAIPLPPTAVTQAVLPQNNARVRLTPVPDSFEENNSDENGNDYEIPDRETLKRYTTQMINARLKGKQIGKKKKKSKKEDDSD